MIKYEVQICIECDSWSTSSTLVDGEALLYTVCLYGTDTDNAVTLKSYSGSKDGLDAARNYAYDVYNVMDHSETRLVDQTR